MEEYLTIKTMILLKKIKKFNTSWKNGQKNEYNGLIYFFVISSSYLTGSVIVADGGRTII